MADIEQPPLPNATTSRYDDLSQVPAATAAYLNNRLNASGGSRRFRSQRFLAAAALTGSLSKMGKMKLLIGLGVLPLLIGSHCVPQENATASKSVSLGTVEPYFRIESTIPERLKKSPFITQTAEGVDFVGIACADKANGDTLMLTAQRGIDFSAKLERRAALYGYVNGIGRAFTTKGAKLTKITPKDLEALDYSKPIKLDLELALADETPLFITMNVFFEQYGYSNAAWSTDKARLKHLESIVRGVKAGTRASDLTGNSKP